MGKSSLLQSLWFYFCEEELINMEGQPDWSDTAVVFKG